MTPRRLSRPRRRKAVGPVLKRLLYVLFGLFSLLVINAAYLGGVTFLEWFRGETFQGYFYQLMFLGHLLLGLILLGAFVVYGFAHVRNAHDNPNRRAVKVGYGLLAVGLVLLVSGLVLTRGIPVIEVRHPGGRELAYWLHVVTPLVAAWLFVLHRLAGPRINWRFGAGVAVTAALVSAVAIGIQMQDPRRWDAVGPAEGEAYFLPSLARTASGNFIPARALMQDAYCAECHEDAHEGWSRSVHRFASFNNPAYLFSVRKTREFALARDGNVRAARFCAGCHDLVPFFAGAFDDPNFDDVNHPTAQAGITCTGCHAITHVNSALGNASYTIEEPLHYPFKYSDSEFLQWVNRTLVKAKPEFHRKTFLKPLHRTPEFCATCHKVHLPEALNGYRWLRGQNHYDSFLLSGVSGHGVTSFYYPEQAHPNCNGCHMPQRPSDDFGARDLDGSGTLAIHDHQFAAANTAVPMMVGLPESVIEPHREFLEGSLRVDIFGLREGGTSAGRLLAPLRPALPVLQPGQTYLIEAVLRTLTLGHLFTQGTADSNEVWVDVEVTADERVIGRSGAMDPVDGTVDPWSHFVNAWVIDREGRRIDRRNAENIFTVLYNNQIPPGAADVVHYRLTVPEDVVGPVTIEVSLKYRKFDTTYLRLIRGDEFRRNDLPVTVIASDRVTLPVAAGGAAPTIAGPDVPDWMRWNDYGIGLLRKGGAGELRQAEEAFTAVEGLGRPDGPLNLARVYLREGRLPEAGVALGRALVNDPPARPWSVTWFKAQLDRQNGNLDEAIAGFRDLAETRFNEARQRGFDFGRDYRLLNALAETLFERSKLARSVGDEVGRQTFLEEAQLAYSAALAEDPENATALWGLAQIAALEGDAAEAARLRALHARYKPDDNAGDRAVALARRANPAANHAAEDVVVYDLQRPGTYGLPAAAVRTALN
jgi:tetratricopeptide (TPR) repeat protein